jgi:hypothetical protein
MKLSSNIFKMLLRKKKMKKKMKKTYVTYIFRYVSLRINEHRRIKESFFEVSKKKKARRRISP